MICRLIRKARRLVELARWADSRQRAEQQEIEHHVRMKTNRAYRDAQVRRWAELDVEPDGVSPSRRSS